MQILSLNKELGSLIVPGETLEVFIVMCFRAYGKKQLQNVKTLLTHRTFARIYVCV